MFVSCYVAFMVALTAVEGRFGWPWPPPCSSTLTSVTEFLLQTANEMISTDSETEDPLVDVTVTSIVIATSIETVANSTLQSCENSSTPVYTSDTMLTSDTAFKTTFNNVTLSTMCTGLTSGASDPQLHFTGTSLAETSHASPFTGTEGTVTITEGTIGTTFVVITSCKDNTCSTKTYKTGVKTITTSVSGNSTEYTTYCPLSSTGSVATETGPVSHSSMGTPGSSVQPSSESPPFSSAVKTTSVVTTPVTETTESHGTLTNIAETVTNVVSRLKSVNSSTPVRTQISHTTGKIGVTACPSRKTTTSSSLHIRTLTHTVTVFEHDETLSSRPNEQSTTTTSFQAIVTKFTTICECPKTTPIPCTYSSCTTTASITTASTTTASTNTSNPMKETESSFRSGPETTSTSQSPHNQTWHSSESLQTSTTTTTSSTDAPRELTPVDLGERGYACGSSLSVYDHNLNLWKLPPGGCWMYESEAFIEDGIVMKYIRYEDTNAWLCEVIHSDKELSVDFDSCVSVTETASREDGIEEPADAAAMGGGIYDAIYPVMIMAAVMLLRLVKWLSRHITEANLRAVEELVREFDDSYKPWIEYCTVMVFSGVEGMREELLRFSKSKALWIFNFAVLLLNIIYITKVILALNPNRQPAAVRIFMIRLVVGVGAVLIFLTVTCLLISGTSADVFLFNQLMKYACRSVFRSELNEPEHVFLETWDQVLGVCLMSFTAISCLVVSTMRMMLSLQSKGMDVCLVVLVFHKTIGVLSFEHETVLLSVYSVLAAPLLGFAFVLVFSYLD